MKLRLRLLCGSGDEMFGRQEDEGRMREDEDRGGGGGGE